MNQFTTEIVDALVKNKILPRFFVRTWKWRSTRYWRQK